MLGRPVRPSVWEITGNVGLCARMRNGGWWRWKLKSENWKLRDVLAWETENQRRFVLPRRKVTNVSKDHHQRKKQRKNGSKFTLPLCKVQPLGSKNWSSVEERRGRGDQLAICKGCKVQKVIYCVCQSLKKRLCTAFTSLGFYVHLLILIFSMKTAQVGCRDKLLAISFSSNFYVRVLVVFGICTKSGMKK